MSGATIPMAVRGRGLLARARRADRISLAIGAVFLLSAAFYAWTSNSALPLSLHDGTGDRYNLLASALLHLHLSVGPASAELLSLGSPHNPDILSHLPNSTNDANSVNDDAMYNGHLYFVWGPAPALVLLVPLHLLGFEPSSSVTVLVFAIAGLGFALATLRLLIRQIGDLPLWMCVLASFAVSLTSVVPYLMRTPNVTTDTLAGGYCFVMAGVWLAISAIAEGRASTVRLVVMSICFGLAANSRPTLALTALILIPVYLSLRPSRSRRALLMSIALPVGICFALLLAYNQARFNSPFEVGSNYQLSINNQPPAPHGQLSFVLPGVLFYALTPPRFEVLFPFMHLLAPQVTPPTGVPNPEMTGGLLPMAPIVVFIVALPWIWRRRPALLGRLAAPFTVLAGIGLLIPLLPAYQFYSSTERYELDFATLLVFGALAAWLSLSHGLSGYRRRLVRVGGGLLVAWSCLAGFAISFYGSVSELALTHPAAWRTFEDVGSPLSTLLATAAGHPVLGAIHATAAGIQSESPHPALSTSISDFFLTPTEHAGLTIVSPSSGKAGLLLNVELAPKASYRLLIRGPGNESVTFALPSGGGLLELPISLNRGLNRFRLSPVGTPSDHFAGGERVMAFDNLSVTSVR